MSPSSHQPASLSPEDLNPRTSHPPPTESRKRTRLDATVDDVDTGVQDEASYANRISDHFAPLEGVLDEWLEACEDTPGFADRTISLLRGGLNTHMRILLIDTLQRMQPLTPTLFHHHPASLPPSPPESAGIADPTFQPPTLCSAYPHQSIPPGATRLRSFSQPIFSTYHYMAGELAPQAPSTSTGGNRAHIPNVAPSPFTPVSLLSSSGEDTGAFSYPSAHTPPREMMKPRPYRSPSLPMTVSSLAGPRSINLPRLPRTSGSSIGMDPSDLMEMSPTSGSASQRNSCEIFVLHDRDLQSRYPNDSLEKSIQELHLIKRTTGQPGRDGVPMKLYTFSPAQSVHYGGGGTPTTSHYFAVLDGDVLTTLEQDGSPSTGTTIFRLGVGDVVMTPGISLGSSMWWRQQECRGQHPSTGGGSWTARRKFDLHSLLSSQ
ncbi:hypothetical protein P7C70_g6343, partial [Phenoliferia sp. Uapishka_3]